MNDLKGFEVLRAACPAARILSEGGITYISLPDLRFQSGNQTIAREALLCPQQHGGYMTRLFFHQPVPGKGNNWTLHQILGRTWHTWSWNNVEASLPVADILANHLRALR